MNGERDASPVLSTTDALPAIAEEVPVSRLRRLLYKAVALPVGMMLLLCVLLGWQVAALVDENEVVAYSQRVIGESHQVQKLLIDHETGLRGYLLTGDPGFLQPYELGRAQLPGRLERLHALVEGRPAQRERVEAIAAGYREWLAVEGQPTAGAAGHRPGDVALAAAMRARKQRMDGMRQLSAEVIAAEDALLHAREDTAARQRSWTIVGGTALLLAFGGFMATFMRRWFRQMENIYAKALARSFRSEAGERAARQAAEALADEITAQSRELAARLRAMRSELAAARGVQREA